MHDEDEITRLQAELAGLRDAYAQLERSRDAERQARAMAEARGRAVGADMVTIVNAAAAYYAAMTWSPSQDPKWKPGDGIIDYKTPEDRLKKLLKGPNRPGVALLAELDAARAYLAYVLDAYPPTSVAEQTLRTAYDEATKARDA